MNELDLDRLAARASASVRHEADRIADSHSALALLLVTADMPTAEGGEASDLVVLESAQPDRRPPWWRTRRVAWIGGAAAAVIAVAAIGFVARDDDSISTVDMPSVPPTAASIPPSTAPSAPDPTAPPTAPAPTVPTPVPGTTTITDTEFGDQLDRVVLGSFADGELGFEECQECEPTKPWAPVYVTMGTTTAEIDPILLVADAFNRRWVKVVGDTTATVPFGDAVVVGSPVVGPDHLVYALVGPTFNQLDPRRVVAYDPATMSEVASYDVSERIANRLDVWNGQLLLGDEIVTTFDLPLGTPTIDIDQPTPTTAPTVTISLSGVQHSFVLPDGWLVAGRDAVPRDHGSVLVRVFRRPLSDSAPQRTALLRLWADGTYATRLVSDDNRNAAPNLDAQLAPWGLVQLEDGEDGGTEVAAYIVDSVAGDPTTGWTPTTSPAASQPPGDPLAGWQFPDVAPASLDDVPYLLPDPMPASTRALRFEGASAAAPQRSQLWMRALADGRIDAVLMVDTRLGPVSPWSGTRPAVVAGWPQALTVDTEPGTVLLQLSSDLGFVEIRSHGLADEETLAIAESLRVSADGDGWASSELAGWTEFPGAFTSGYAYRTVVTFGAGGSPEYELGASVGIPIAQAGPGVYVRDGRDLFLSEVDGRPAVVERGGFVQSIVWSTPEGTVITIGTTAGDQALMDVVATLREVDRATWEAAAEPPSPLDDGCLGLFC